MAVRALDAWRELRPGSQQVVLSYNAASKASKGSLEKQRERPKKRSECYGLIRSKSHMTPGLAVFDH